jgi:hypothetical protein
LQHRLPRLAGLLVELTRNPLRNTNKGEAGKNTNNGISKAIRTSGDIIGRYERDEVNPRIEVAVKIADALDIFSRLSRRQN